MLLKPNTHVVEGLIELPDGSKASRPTTLLTEEEARVIRAYRRIKQKYGIIEENHCKACFEGDRSDGMRGHTTDSAILYECRCRMLFYGGQTF